MNSSASAVGDFLLSIGEKFVISTSALSFISNLLVYHSVTANCISLLLSSIRSLKSKPHLVKAITHICVVFFWHWLILIIYEPWSILTNLVVVSVDVQMCFMFFLMEGVIKALNKSIKEHYDIIKENIEGTALIYRDEPCLKTDQPNESVSNLRHVHSLLYKVMQDANKGYGVPAFFIALNSRFLFTLYLYRWLKQDSPIIELLKAWISFQRILYICYRLESLKLEETRVSELLNDLDMSVLDTRRRIDFNLFLLQTESFSLTFTAVYLFTLDFSLISTIFTTTMTYLLLLSQF